MRKTLTALLTFAVLAGAAAPAMADDPNAVHTRNADAKTIWGGCKTAYKPGVDYQYGAWGAYLDGCTVKLQCPVYKATCMVLTRGHINTSPYYGRPVTLNSRVRVFSASNTLYWWRDKSCSGNGSCSTPDTVYIRGGEYASQQCNGVRQVLAGNLGQIHCTLDIRIDG
jgi:hypothetical protein